MKKLINEMTNSKALRAVDSEILEKHPSYTIKLVRKALIRLNGEKNDIEITLDELRAIETQTKIANQGGEREILIPSQNLKISVNQISYKKIFETTTTEWEEFTKLPTMCVYTNLNFEPLPKDFTKTIGDKPHYLCVAHYKTDKNGTKEPILELDKIKELIRLEKGDEHYQSSIIEIFRYGRKIF